jgi:hypothetical protein
MPLALLYSKYILIWHIMVGAWVWLMDIAVESVFWQQERTKNLKWLSGPFFECVRLPSRTPFYQGIILWPSNTSYHTLYTLDYMPCEFGEERPLPWPPLAWVFLTLSRHPSHQLPLTCVRYWTAIIQRPFLSSLVIAYIMRLWWSGVW